MRRKELEEIYASFTPAEVQRLDSMSLHDLLGASRNLDVEIWLPEATELLSTYKVEDKRCQELQMYLVHLMGVALVWQSRCDTCYAAWVMANMCGFPPRVRLERRQPEIPDELLI